MFIIAIIVFLFLVKYFFSNLTHMSTAQNNGWDFVKIDETYHYKEGSFIAMISIIDDKSDEKNYRFTIKILEANRKPR